MATGTEQAQSHMPTCTEHTHQLLLSYCKTCHKRVCEKCVKGPHSGHDWTFLQNHIREVRNEGEKIAKEIRDEVIAFLKGKRDGTSKKEEVKKIRRMQAKLKNLVDECADEMVAQLDDDPQATDVDKEIDEFEKLADFFEKNVKTEYDSAVVEMEEELQAKLCRHRTSKVATQSHDWRFKEGMIDEVMIKSMMGRVEKVNQIHSTSMLDVTVVKKTKHGENMITSIADIPEGKAWIGCKETGKITLIDMDGKEREMQNYEPFFSGFTMKNNSYIFTTSKKKYIGFILSTEPHGPTGICSSHDDGILVCMTDCSLSDITLISQGEVHHIDKTGRIKKVYRQDEADQKKLFTWPYRVAQNVNSDLCVCDFLEPNWRSGRLVVVTAESKVRFSYTGQRSLKMKFAANAVVCDSSGRIILSDGHNSAIHVLSADGCFIQFLLSSKDELSTTTALALNGDTMWVGRRNGEIRICKLRERFNTY